MSGHVSDGLKLCRSPRDIQRDGRRYKSNGYLSEERATLLESCDVDELSTSLPELSDHSLPSERLRQAATHRYMELQRSGRSGCEREASGSNETTPLLSSASRESAFSDKDVVQNTHAEREASNPHQSVTPANDLRVSVSIGGRNARKERKQLKRDQ